MKIYISYISKINKAKEKNLVPVFITRYIPKSLNVISIKSLAPSSKLLFDYKKSGNQKLFEDDFKIQLSKLEKSEILKELQNISKQNDNKDIVLVCYEKPSDFCHRHIVADWLGNDTEELVL